MKKLSTKVMSMEFGKAAKRLVILTLIVAVAGALLSALLLWPQISGAVSAIRAGEASERFHIEQNIDGWQNDNHRGGGDREGHEGEDGWQLRAALSGVPTPSAGALITVGVWGLLLALLLAAWHLLIAAWLFRTSNRAWMHQWLWLLLGLAAPWAAVPAFLILRGFLRQHCPACGQWQRKGSFCIGCGTPLLKKCPACGAECQVESRFCGSCGKPLTTPSTEKNTEEEGDCHAAP